MLTEQGRIVAIDDHCLWVETINRSACASCVAEKGCGQSLLARWASRSAFMELPLDGRDPRDFQINDSISIGIPEDLVLKSSLLIYCLPLLALLGGAAVGQHMWDSDVAAIAGAGLGLVIGGFIVKLCTAVLGRGRRLEPVLLDLVSADAPVARHQQADSLREP